MFCLYNLKGLLPASMLDWPGKLCSVLFLGGCNFRCPYCYNPELVEGGDWESTLEWEDVAAFLEQRRGWIDGVCITGGEPTLQADLPWLCLSIREMGFAVKLDTNGSKPRMLRLLLERGLVDFVAMDLKTSLEKYPSLVRRPVDTGCVLESVEAILCSGVEHEFRCTVVPGWVDLQDLQSLARLIEGSRGLVLQQFRPGNTLDPSFAGVKPYPDGVLRQWAEILSLAVPARTRGLQGMNPADTEERQATPYGSRSDGAIGGMPSGRE